MGNPTGPLRPLLLACAVAVLAVPVARADKPIERGPLKGLPGAPAPHVETIKALGDNAWLSLGAPKPDPAYLWLEGGFDPGKFYEVVYRTDTCPVVGTGLLSMRELEAVKSEIGMLESQREMPAAKYLQSIRYLERSAGWCRSTAARDFGPVERHYQPMEPLAGGLVGPSVAAALCFTLGKTGQGARWCLIGVGLLLVAVEILVMRNLFGFLFAGAVAAACLFAGARCSPATAQWLVLFLGVQLALRVFSRADYLFTRTAGTYPSDVMQMQQALFLPYWFWGLVCGAFAVLVLLYGFRTVWGR